MTTPQNELYQLGNRIRHLTDLFEADENDETIFDKMHNIDLRMEEIAESQERQENLMNLIVKLLSKDGK